MLRLSFILWALDFLRDRLDGFVDRAKKKCERLYDAEMRLNAERLHVVGERKRAKRVSSRLSELLS